MSPVTLKTIIFIALVWTAGESYAHSEPSTRVIGGNPIEPGELPFLARVRDCGGSIIDEHHILTAAHCVDHTDPNNITVTVGCHNLTDCNRRVAIKSIAVHESYLEDDPVLKLQHDIALMRTKEPIEFSPKSGLGAVGAINLPMQSDGPSQEGQSVVVAGWGYIDENESTDVIARKLEIKTLSLEECRNFALLPVVGIDYLNTTICAGFPQHDACHGNSGGPLFFEGFDNDRLLVGIVSWGGAWCGSSNFGAYTRVASFREWIDRKRDEMAP